MENLEKLNNTGMVTEFRRSLNHNYLILKNAVPEEINCFSLQMIMENRISSLLSINIKNENGERELCYEISSLQSLSRIYEIRKITGEELIDIIHSIIEVFQQMKEYMLTEEEVVMLPEYIFMNPETRRIQFMYCPYIKQNCESLFWELAEFFLDHVEHQDSEAVVLAYQFYKIVRSDNFVLQEIQQLCETQYENKTREKKQDIFTDDGSENIIRAKDKKLDTADNNLIFEETPELESSYKFFVQKRKPPEKMAGKSVNTNRNITQFIIFLIISLLSLVLLFKNPGPINSYSKIINIGFFLFGLGGTAVCVIKSKFLKREYYAERNISKEKDIERMTDHFFQDQKNEDILGQMQTTLYEKQKEDRPYNEPVYGKTEFCLITPEEEKRVLVEKRHGKEIRHKIETLPYTIGKLKDMSDLYISDNTVSRLHARIFEEEGKLYVLDLGSTNGTYLNGISINQEEKFLLEAGDELRIGKTEFVYE